MKNTTWMLKYSLLFQGVALGIGAIVFDTPLANFLFLNWDYSEKLAYGLDDLLGLLLILVSFLSLFNQSAPNYFFMFFYFFMYALIQMIIGGIPHADLVIFAHACRFLSPLAFFLLLNKEKYGILLLKLGLSLTFFTHGIECFLKEPLFVDYLIFAQKGLSEFHAGYLLYVIGSIDIFLAIFSIFFPRREIYYYMTFWGFLTAFYRVLFEGYPGVISMMIRSSHFMVPWFLSTVTLKFSKEKWGTI